MIIDNIKNCEKYFTVNKKFEKAFNFIKASVKENYDSGKYEIDGDDIYASIMEYITKDETDCKFEGHRKYIDIQFLVCGAEAMAVADISKMSANTEYSEEKDVLFFENYNNPTVAVINEGEFAVFFPNDIHKPSIALGGNKATVKKTVVKISI